MILTKTRTSGKSQEVRGQRSDRRLSARLIAIVRKIPEAGRQRSEIRRQRSEAQNCWLRRSITNFQMIMIFAEEGRRRDLTGALALFTFAAR